MTAIDVVEWVRLTAWICWSADQTSKRESCAHTWVDGGAHHLLRALFTFGGGHLLYVDNLWSIRTQDRLV